MEQSEDTFERLLSVMPAGREEQARINGAPVRPWEIKTVEDLPRIIFLYVTGGRPPDNTAILFSISGEYHPGNTAVHKRIGNSAALPRRLCEHFCQNNRLLRDVCMADAGGGPVFGSAKAWFPAPFTFCCCLTRGHGSCAWTGTKEGEKLSNFQNFKAGDIVMGDRAYGTIAGMEYVRERGCDFVLRLRTKAFIVYDAQRRETGVPA